MKYNNETEFNKVNMFGTGVENIDYAKFFVGKSFLNALSDINKDSLFIANVTFEPGCRNNWHTHRAKTGGGQVLICTAGEGWYQAQGQEAIELKEGMTIVIPANVKHWHGAKKDSWFSHIAFGIPGEETANEWYEAVTDEEYAKLNN
ncbi:MAG: cupin domain-containing protein [Mycoplasmatales bacterium]